MKNIGSMSITAKITAFTLAALIVCSTAIGVAAYYLDRSAVVSESAKRALAYSQAAASALDPAQYAGIMETGETNAYYEWYIEYLDGLLDMSGAVYLYVLDADYGTEVTYFAEGYADAGDPGEPEFLLGDTEDAAAYADEMFNDTIANGRDAVTGVYSLGGYGAMVSGFSPILDGTGAVLGVAGVDLPIETVLASTNRFGLIMLIIELGISVAVALIIVINTKKTVGQPINRMVGAAEKLAVGDLDIAAGGKKRGDEIGKLEDAFREIVTSTDEQSKLLARIADGDLTAEVRPRSAADTMGGAMYKMVTRLSEMFTGIQHGIEQVSSGAERISEDAQVVASGAAAQSETVGQLSGTIRSLTDMTVQNTQMAEQAANLSGAVIDNARKGDELMGSLLAAVSEINEASRSIGKVIEVIDEIAFQTNILAINAAVEAASAGVHGRSFAVVAEEVRKLANRSARAAKDTGDLISSSTEKAALGVKIAGETSASLKTIVDGINESAAIINSIAQKSGEQYRMIDSINGGISEFVNVIEQNSETAQKSAAASEEMSSQFIILREMISRFRL